ncbi:hypothetical protein GGF31_000999 [Allomyces arbusculus]|nr:hypothetical protein GGF31_000999 [Allomyces arbusculus]
MPATALAFLAVVLALVLIAASGTAQASPNPQIGDIISGILKPSKPTPTSSGDSTATPTATPDVDPCDTGRCTPPNLKTECILLEKLGGLNAFKGVYLPVDVRPYFRDRFPGKYDDSVFPSELKNITDFQNLFGNMPWSYPTNNADFYNEKTAGCKLPDQRYYITWVYVDMVDYFKNTKKDACSVGASMPVCATTFDQRVLVVNATLNNVTMCSGPAEYKAKGQAYLKQLQTHPFRSTDTTTCVSGDTIEKGGQTCGYYGQFSACLHADTCTDLASDLRSQCPTVLQNWAKANNPSVFNNGSSSDGSSSKFPVGAVVIGVVAAGVVIVGLVSLARTRAKSASLMKTLGRTLGRVTRSRTTLRRPAQEPPVPDVIIPTAAPSAEAMAAYPSAPAPAAQPYGGAYAAPPQAYTGQPQVYPPQPQQPYVSQQQQPQFPPQRMG